MSNLSIECCVGLKKRVREKALCKNVEIDILLKPNVIKNEKNQQLKRRKKLDAERRNSSSFRRR